MTDGTSGADETLTPPALAGATQSTTSDAARDISVPGAAAEDIVEPGRLSFYTLLGSLSALLPLPWVPLAIERRLRGALVHDIATRFSLSLSRDGRRILEAPAIYTKDLGALSVGIRYVTSRVLSRLGPLVFFGSARAAVETFALGHLLVRYLEVHRLPGARRIDECEARAVRRAIDRAVLMVLATDGARPLSRPNPAHDDRDAFTTLVDAVLMRAASLPAWVVRRLDAAFDDALRTTLREPS
jgi:hypothetical protein